MGVFFLLAIAMLSGCSDSNLKSDSGNAIETSFGWVHGECLAIDNSNLVFGDDVTVVGVLEGHEVSKATIGKNAVSSENCYALLEGRKEINTSSGYTFYILNGIPNTSTFGLSIVLAGRQPELVVIDGVANIDIDGDGFNETFGQCSTSEGVRFYLSSVSSSDTVWEGYYYLGYDSEATCS